ncbi:MAG: hypothetical protein K2Z81_26985, partial [Cyanobacteria bacterium]|nr:hypothetical protein [Cyanobacteriota bacterium]
KFLVSVSGSESNRHIDYVICEEFLVPFYELLREFKDEPRLSVEAVLMIGNGLVGSESSRDRILNTRFVPYIIEIFFTSSVENARKEAMWALGALVALGGQSVYVTNVAVDIQRTSFAVKNMTEAHNDRVIQLVMLAVEYLRRRGKMELARMCLGRMFSLERRVRVFDMSKKED